MWLLKKEWTVYKKLFKHNSEALPFTYGQYVVTELYNKLTTALIVAGRPV